MEQAKMAKYMEESDCQTLYSIDTQIEQSQPMLSSIQSSVSSAPSKYSQDVEQLLKVRAITKEEMKRHAKKNCEGKEEYVSFDNHSKMLEVNYYKKFIWPICKSGLALNMHMFEVCSKLWKLNYRDYGEYLEATYIFI